MEDTEMETHPGVPARWTDDCQGKKDFDGRLVNLSTRYWPYGGGFSVITRHGHGGVSIEDASTISKAPPSAHASLHFQLPDAQRIEGWQNWLVIAEERFKGETQEEVQRQVETWAVAQYTRLRVAIEREFGPMGRGDR